MGVYNTADRFLPRQHPAASHTQLIQNLSGAFTDNLVIVHHQYRKPGKLCVFLLRL